MERTGAKFEEIRSMVAGVRGRKVHETGDIEAGIWSAGMAQGLIHDVPSVKELIERIVTQAERIIERLRTLSAGPTT